MDRIGITGRERVEEFASELETGQALEALARAKRRRAIGICLAWPRIAIGSAPLLAICERSPTCASQASATERAVRSRLQGPGTAHAPSLPDLHRAD
jgi:hypothetical protein